MSTESSHQDGGEPRTCRYLESALAIFGNRLQACCVTHHRNRGHLLLADGFDGTELPLEAIFRARKAALAQLCEPEGPEPCRGCIMVGRKQSAPSKHPFDFIAFANGFTCNLRCTYCIPLDRGYHRSLSEVPTLPAVKQLAELKLLAPDLHVEWSGGEPTLGPDFAETSSFLATLGASQALFTNAVVLSEAALDWIPPSLTRMLVSVDAGTRETYRIVKGLDAFDTVWAHIRRYVRAGGRRILVKMVLLPQNRHEVTAFVRRAEVVGVQTVVVDVNHLHERVTDADVAAAAEMLEQCARRGIRLQAGFHMLHGRPEERFHDRVAQRHAERLREHTFTDRLVQRVGTAKGLRHIVRLARAAYRRGQC